jgi:hypothetical protein
MRAKDIVIVADLLCEKINSDDVLRTIVPCNLCAELLRNVTVMC